MMVQYKCVPVHGSVTVSCKIATSQPYVSVPTNPYSLFFFYLQELYQKLTDFDIRFYMYELLKVRLVYMAAGVLKLVLPQDPGSLKQTNTLVIQAPTRIRPEIHLRS